jgi:hypothetical protein
MFTLHVSAYMAIFKLQCGYYAVYFNYSFSMSIVISFALRLYYFTDCGVYWVEA